jgi:formyl-CoA transferase
MFRTQDGYINIAANQQQQWEDLLDELGLPELKISPLFQERDTRKANRHQLTPILEDKLIQKPTAHWVESLNARGIPSGEILNLEEALTSEQVKHRRVIEDVEQPGIGLVKVFNLTAKFSKTPAEITAPSPQLSEHTEGILVELGYTSEEIKDLKKKAVI